MDPVVFAPAVFGEPLSWAAWLGVGAASAQWPDAWRRSAVLAAVGLVAASAAAVGASVALVACGLIWATSLARLGGFAGALVEHRMARAVAGAAAVAVLIAADVGAQRLTGAAGSVLDAVAPSVALREALHGSASLGSVATLALPGVIGWAGAGVLEARRVGGSLANAWATALLAPGLLLLGGFASEPLPAPWDGTAAKTANLHPNTVLALHRLDRPILFSSLHQAPAGLDARAAARRFERLVSGLTRTSMRPVSVERRDPKKTQEYLQSQGVAPEPIGPHALAIRALDRSVMVPLVSAEGLQARVATALWSLAPEETGGPVLVAGEPMPGLDLGRDGDGFRPDDEPVAEGARAIVVLPSEQGISPAGLARLDAHVMGGGGLLVLYGEPLPDGPRRGVPLTNPWGFHAQGSGFQGRAVASGEWLLAGFDGLRVPLDAPSVTGPDGLGEAVATLGGDNVAMAMIGSVPSGFPDGPRAQSDGAARVFLASAALARENPSLVARAMDWVLDEAVLAPLRGTRGTPPARPLPMLLVLCLLGPLLVAVGGLGRREA